LKCYFILAAALLLPRAWTYLGLTVAIVLLVAIGAAYDTTFPIETFYLANPLMIEFLFGVAIGLLYLRGVRLRSLWCLVAAAAFLCVVAWFPVGSGFIRVLEWGIPSAIIVALVTMGPQPKTGSLVAGGLIVAGDISYALYVTHIVTLIAMRHFGFPSWSIFTASIIAAASTYLWFERPVTGWLQYLLKLHQQRRLAQT
jgi:peptidoglycan/LPS O-acetylase OafA/YrhL